MNIFGCEAIQESMFYSDIRLGLYLSSIYRTQKFGSMETEPIPARIPRQWLQSLQSTVSQALAHFEAGPVHLKSAKMRAVSRTAIDPTTGPFK